VLRKKDGVALYGVFRKKKVQGVRVTFETGKVEEEPALSDKGGTHHKIKKKTKRRSGCAENFIARKKKGIRKEEGGLAFTSFRPGAIACRRETGNRTAPRLQCVHLREHST